jgi:Amt family ammonium transporter
MSLVSHAVMPAIHLAAAAAPGPYATPTDIDSGNTAWVLASAALVLFMTPGLAFFYGGMVRSKNVLGMLMQNYIVIGIVSVIWVLFTFSLAFDKGWGASGNAFIGGFHFAGLRHMTEGVPGLTGFLGGTTDGTGGTFTDGNPVPMYVFAMFQLMFAVITPALIVGSTADRWRFGPFVIFIALWSIFDYAIVAHWVFDAYGWLFKIGAEDFAGGTVVHANAGAAGLAMCLVLGKRKGWPKQAMKPHNVPYVLLGAAMLWFGWFGFNAGSALTAQGAAGPFVTTNTATAAAMLGWCVLERIRDGKATTLGAASGAVAGLVAITPACAFVSPLASIGLGFVVGMACAAATTVKFKLGFDDSLDVVAVHLLGGILGAVSLGFIGNAHYDGLNGLFYGGSAHLLRVQLEGVGAVVGFSFCVTFVLGKLINLFFKNRLSPEEEDLGMDLTQHGEAAYEFDNIGGGSISVGHHPAGVTA